MTRRAFTMQLKPGSLSEYKQHHDNLWPELAAEIERSGIASITTFERDDDLFLISEIADEAAWDRLWNSEVHKRWAEVMQPLMHMRDDGIVAASELTEVFHFSSNGNGHASSVVVAVEESATEPPIESPAPAAEPIPAQTPNEPPAGPTRRASKRKPKKAAGKKPSAAKKSKKVKHLAAKRHIARGAAKKRGKKKATKKAAAKKGKPAKKKKAKKMSRR